MTFSFLNVSQSHRGQDELKSLVEISLVEVGSMIHLENLLSRSALVGKLGQSCCRAGLSWFFSISSHNSRISFSYNSLVSPAVTFLSDLISFFLIFFGGCKVGFPNEWRWSSSGLRDTRDLIFMSHWPLFKIFSQAIRPLLSLSQSRSLHGRGGCILNGVAQLWCCLLGFGGYLFSFFSYVQVARNDRLCTWPGSY